MDGNNTSAKHGRHKQMTQIKKFLADESGATAIEYGLIAVGIALAVFAGAQTLGGAVSGLFGDIATKLKAT